MADTSDVEKALASVCVGVLFPAGGYSEGASTTSSVLAAPVGNAAGTPVPTVCRVYRGWPVTDTLNADLAAGVSHVSIYPEKGAGRARPGFLTKWWDASPATATLSAAVVVNVSTSAITLGGTPAAGQIVALVVGTGRSPVPYAYAVVAADTLTTIAAALAALVPGATSTGATVTAPSNACTATVTQPLASSWMTRAVEQRYRVNLWCPSPWARDALAGAIDAQLAQTFRLSMPDGSPALMRYGGTFVSDFPARQGEWNRSLVMIVSYATTATTIVAPMIVGTVATTTDAQTITTTT